MEGQDFFRILEDKLLGRLLCFVRYWIHVKTFCLYGSYVKFTGVFMVFLLSFWDQSNYFHDTYEDIVCGFLAFTIVFGN